MDPKRIGIIAVAGLIVVGGAFFFVNKNPSLGGSNSEWDAEYVDPVVGGAYDDFFRSQNDPEASLAALEPAEEADPENGYTQYLMASVYAREGETQRALEHIKEGNARPKVVHYVSETPARESMDTLTKLRQIGHGAENLESIPDEMAEEYFLEARQAGVRVMEMEPVEPLGVMAGISIVKRVDKSAVDYFTEQGLEEQVAEWTERRDSFLEWSDTFNETFKNNVNDVIRDAAREAGLNQEETEDVVFGRELEDPEKQRLVEEAFTNMAKEERRVLKELVMEMPRD
jgi:hypothetical protein